jgi:CRP/FNR family transcriptional regulator, cyclic AMP receptor protein
MSQLAAGAAARAAMSLSREAGGMGADWVPVLAEVPLFRSLSRRQLRRVASVARARRFASGSAIVRAGDAGSSFYVLLDGTVRIDTAGGRGRRLRAGEFFGEMALFDDAPRSASVVAEGEVLAMTISRSAFSKLLRSEPGIAQELLRTLAERLRAAERFSE